MQKKAHPSEAAAADAVPPVVLPPPRVGAPADAAEATGMRPMRHAGGP